MTGIVCVLAAKLGQYVSAKRRNGETYKKYVGLNAHDFRRSVIRNMLRRNVGEKISMTISGHSTRFVFDHYALVEGSDLAAATKKIEVGQVQPSVSGIGTSGKSHTRQCKRF